MAKLAKTRAELCMEKTKANVQFQSIPLKSLEETITPKATSHTQFEIMIEQHPQRKELNIEELMVQYMKKEQERSFLTNLDEKPKKEDVEHKEDITLKSGGELEKLQRVEDDAHELKELVVREDESASLEPYEMKEEDVETIPGMAPWGDMHEELKIGEVTPMSKMEECIFQLNKELIATIVEKKKEKKNNKIMEDYVLKLLIEYNYLLLENDGGRNLPTYPKLVESSWTRKTE